MFAKSFLCSRWSFLSWSATFPIVTAGLAAESDAPVLREALAMPEPPETAARVLLEAAVLLDEAALTVGTVMRRGGLLAKWNGNVWVNGCSPSGDDREGSMLDLRVVVLCCVAVCWTSGCGEREKLSTSTPRLYNS
jgi:hypothetical protein